jgi:hypothetical protein
MNAALQIATRDFGRKAINALSRKGIVFVGTQTVPNMASDVPFATGERGYVVSDNGCGRVLTYREVLALV